MVVAVAAPVAEPETDTVDVWVADAEPVRVGLPVGEREAAAESE